MKNFISVLLLLSSLAALGQAPQFIGTSRGVVNARGALKGDSALIFAYRDTTNHPYNDSIGAAVFFKGKLYKRDSASGQKFWDPLNMYETRSAAEIRRMTAVDAKTVYRIDGGEFVADLADNISPDDSAMVIVAGETRLKRVVETEIRPEWFGARRNGSTDDGPAFQKMFDWLSASANRNFLVKLRPGTYQINTSVNLPLFMPATNQFIQVTIDGGGATLRTSSGIKIFNRMPTDHPIAAQAISEYTLTIKNLTFQGGLISGSVGVRAAALYTPVIDNCTFIQLDTAIVAPFWLNGEIRNCFFQQSVSVAILGLSGQNYWPGGTVSNSSFNINNIEGCRIFNRNGAFAGVQILGGDGNIVQKTISEGQNPAYDFYFDYQGATTSKSMTFRDIWCESNGGSITNNTSFFLRWGGVVKLSHITNDYPDYLFVLNNPLNGAKLLVQDIGYLPSAGRIFSCGGSAMNNIDIDVSGMSVGIADYFVDTTRWQGGVAPPIYVNSGYQQKSHNNGIYIRPDVNGTTNNRVLFLAGSFVSTSDNSSSYNIGFRGSNTNMRFNKGVFGSGGLVVSETSTTGFAFGDAASSTQGLRRRAGTTDVLEAYGFTGALEVPRGTTGQRPSLASGRFRFNNDSSKLEVATGASGVWRTIAFSNNNYFASTGPSGYTGNFHSSLSAYDWITKLYADSLFQDTTKRGSVTITTTDGTPGTMAMYVPPGNQGTIEITMQAHNTANNEILAGKKIVTMKNIGGTYTILGSVQVIASDQSETSLSGASWNVTISGGVPVIEVTGIAATFISWRATYTKIFQPLTFD